MHRNYSRVLTFFLPAAPNGSAELHKHGRITGSTAGSTREFPARPLQPPCGADSKGKIFWGQIKWQHEETRAVLWLCIHFPLRAGWRRPIQCAQPARQPLETRAFPPGWRTSINAQRLQTASASFQTILSTAPSTDSAMRPPKPHAVPAGSTLPFHKNRPEMRLLPVSSTLTLPCRPR